MRRSWATWNAWTCSLSTKWDELKLDYTLKGTPEASAKLAEQVRGIFRREGFPDCVH